MERPVAKKNRERERKENDAAQNNNNNPFYFRKRKRLTMLINKGKQWKENSEIGFKDNRLLFDDRRLSFSLMIFVFRSCQHRVLENKNSRFTTAIINIEKNLITASLKPKKIHSWDYLNDQKEEKTNLKWLSKQQLNKAAVTVKCLSI